MRAVVVLTLVVCLAGVASAKTSRLRSDGSWIRDTADRVVLLRGINYSGLEFGNFFGATHGPEEADFDQMASWGVNVGGTTGVAGGFLAATELALRDQLDEQDERLVGGAPWAYFPTDNGFSVVDAAGNEKGALVDFLAEPYPQATAGVPQSIAWDPDTRVFTYTFAEDTSRRIADPTTIFVPFARYFPTGVVVETTPGDRATVDTNRNRVLVRRDRTRAVHIVTIRPE